MRLEICTLSDSKDLKQLTKFLLKQALWYPKYDQWVNEVCIPEIDSGSKTTILARQSGNIIGNVIWQSHKQLPKIREIKNLRIDQSFRRRDLAHFLLKQVEIELIDEISGIICDVDNRKLDVIKLLQFSGYKPLYQMPLYCENNVDIIYFKQIN